MAQQQQGARGNGNGMGMEGGLALFIMMFAILITALWIMHHDALVRWCLHYSWFLSFLPAWVAVKAQAVDSYPVNLIRTISDMSYHIPEIGAGATMDILWKSSMYLMPLMIVPVLWGRRAANHPIGRTNILHEYWGLMNIQARTNPCIVPVVRFTEFWKRHGIERDPVLFRALTPDEFARDHALIRRRGGQDNLDTDRTTKVFTDQIGPKLDVSGMSRHRKALAVIFMTRIVFRGESGRRRGKEMLDAINRSTRPHKPDDPQAQSNYLDAFDFSCADRFDELFKRKEIQAIAKHFAHEKTFLMRLLNEARKDGKLAPPEFLWLKLVDRDLWYALYGVSRALIAKAYPEAAGPFCQYWAAISAMEKGQVLVEPFVAEAVRGFEKRLFEANMVSDRLLMADRERRREEEFGRIPEV